MVVLNLMEMPEGVRVRAAGVALDDDEEDGEKSCAD